ncbi:MAG: lipoyl synthase [Candidatus Omnitrophota bacterium]|jgi:lipoic acid synthetase
MLKLEPVRCSSNGKKLPVWFKQEIPEQGTLKIRDTLSGFGVRTVCQEAYCPNISGCFSAREAAFMILGDTCTRTCRFCAVRKSNGIGRPLDFGEPSRIANAAKALGIKYVVVTSVARDDLSDGGSSVFAETIKSIKSLDINTGIEVLVPDFSGDLESIKKVLAAKPDVFAHNIETVKRLYSCLRPEADYKRSLELLNKSKELNKNILTKSSIMLGLGETKEEIINAMKDLRNNNCDILTLGQYLAPSSEHYPVREFVNHAQFDEYRSFGVRLGFKTVLSLPLARSSYKAQEVFQEAKRCMI